MKLRSGNWNELSSFKLLFGGIWYIQLTSVEWAMNFSQIPMPWYKILSGILQKNTFPLYSLRWISHHNAMSSTNCPSFSDVNTVVQSSKLKPISQSAIFSDFCFFLTFLKRRFFRHTLRQANTCLKVSTRLGLYSPSDVQISKQSWLYDIVFNALCVVGWRKFVFLCIHFILKADGNGTREET
jgi:hypothetical protein